MKQDKRVAKVMNSLEGIQRAKAPHDGFAKIRQNLADQRQQEQTAAYGWMKVAAVIAFVVTSNVWAVTNFLQTGTAPSAETGSYTQITTDFNLYE
ncbi:hypothetical protein [Pontibacter oryzae]|uniref:Uncharacterized protein n=1 Tax=Pontibacter oryzae TaxID=2304593 RepID=A0A399SLQ9_9BACT|nr:hypothetical protein [Pontibacter oryzae]RIJ42897.1 hypothetical protein D1627_03380 [Pontibacter oryzae]